MKKYILNYLSETISEKGIERGKALKDGICFNCGQEAKNFRDDLSKKEYHLTAYCQCCQDKLFGK